MDDVGNAKGLVLPSSRLEVQHRHGGTFEEGPFRRGGATRARRVAPATDTVKSNSKGAQRELCGSGEAN